ncbi:MAG: hypothetical protein ABH813_01325 [Patescibacteria group bacterium]
MFPYTGITQIFGALVLLYLAYRFWRIYQIEKYLVAKLFSCAFLFFSLIFLTLGIPSLFFIKAQAVWLAVMILTCLFQSLAGATLGYIFFYLKFPQVPPKCGFFLIFLIELLLVTPSFIHPPIYFFEPSGVVGWEIDPLVGILRYLGILLFLIPIGIIYLVEAKKAAERRVKIRAYGLGLGFLGFTVVYLLDFIIFSIFDVDAKWTDISLGVCFLILLSMILLTPKMIKHSARAKFVK